MNTIVYITLWKFSKLLYCLFFLLSCLVLSFLSIIFSLNAYFSPSNIVFSIKSTLISSNGRCKHLWKEDFTQFQLSVTQSQVEAKIYQKFPLKSVHNQTPIHPIASEWPKLNIYHPGRKRGINYRGQKFSSSACNYEWNLERMSNSSQSTRPVGRVLREELLVEVI